MRDNFDEKTKQILAKRVGFRCSNPNCRIPTSGPQEDETKAINIGVAAHISAAAPGGERYNSELSSRERMSPENGIWLCQNCAKLIDSDSLRFTRDLLLQWKHLSERAALLEIESPSDARNYPETEDIDLLRFYSECFDRPAFQDPFHVEGSMEAFDQAIEDTITAINTGTLRARDGSILSQARGKSYLKNSQWRDILDTIVDLLRAIRSQYMLAVQSGQIYLGDEYHGKQFYVIHDWSVVDWMDGTRSEIIRLFSGICNEVGIPPLHFPRQHKRRSLYPDEGE